MRVEEETALEWICHRDQHIGEDDDDDDDDYNVNDNNEDRGGNCTGVICHGDQHTGDDDNDYNNEDRWG